MYESRDGGKTWNCDFFRGVFGDFRSIWWDEQDPQRIMLGSDGGVNVSYDGGRTADYFLNKRVGEVYAVGVDMDDPVQRLRRPAGPRFVEGTEQLPGAG